jgi:hypothetical protein
MLRIREIKGLQRSSYHLAFSYHFDGRLNSVERKTPPIEMVGFGSERVVSVRASAADEGTTDFWFLASDRSQLAEDAQAQL